jgi:hypothetical protein
MVQEHIGDQFEAIGGKLNLGTGSYLPKWFSIT